MTRRLIVFRLVRSVAIAASCCMFFGCGHEPVSIVLEYKVDRSPQETGQIDMGRVVAAANVRVRGRGRARATGDEHFDVDIYGEVDQPELERIKRRIESPGNLEFRITANTNDHQDIIVAAIKSPAKLVRIGERVRARWVKLDTTQFDINDPSLSNTYVIRTDVRWPEVLVVMDLYNVTGEYIVSTRPGLDQSGRPSLHFTFNSRGANLFGRLTGANLPIPATQFYRHLGIVLDDQLISAPRLNSRITSRGEITGNFTNEEVEFIVGILNAGSLPVRIKEVAQRPVRR